MQSLYYVMAIMGCGDDGAACRQARIEPVRYESATSCQAAMADALDRNLDLSYPVIRAACERRGLMMADVAPAPRTGG